MSEERKQPSELDAEKTVLGAVLVENRAFNDAAELLTRDDWYRPGHRVIFEAMATLYEKGEPIDLVTLRSQLFNSSTLDQAGGTQYLAGLVEGVPRLENVAPWCNRIREASARRQLISASRRIEQLAYETGEDSATVLDRAEDAIFQVADRNIRGEGLVPVASVVRETFQEIEAEAQGEGDPGASTGFVELDRYLGGLKAPDLYILAARPAMGKTSLALQIAHACEARGPVAFFSLEMSRKQLVRRLICCEARVDSMRLRQRRLEQRDWERLTSSYATFARSSLHIDDESSPTPLELRAKIRRLRSRYPDLSLVVVDYLQLMDCGIKTNSREQEVSYIARSLKGIAKDMNLPVLALSQLSRNTETRADKEPQLSDLRESGAIEQDADAVLFIHRPEEYKATPENTGLARILIAKQRNGPTGVAELGFVAEYTRFENIAPPFEEPLEGNGDEDGDED